MPATTSDRAAEFVAKSRQSRPATDGNKNTNARAKRMNAMSQKSEVAGVIKKNLIGPYLGR